MLCATKCRSAVVSAGQRWRACSPGDWVGTGVHKLIALCTSGVYEVITHFEHAQLG